MEFCLYSVVKTLIISAKEHKNIKFVVYMHFVIFEILKGFISVGSMLYIGYFQYKVTKIVQYDILYG